MFAKLYETTEHGQILVTLDSTEDGEPVIKYSCQPEGLGICYAQSPPFENSENGWFIAEQVLKDETCKSATEMVEVVILTALDEMEIVEISYEQQKQQRNNSRHTLH
jgi:hypothetical protein